ncbi:type II toxin-antitoxin system VapC family toxin [cf. Phormidesmis sp. LEGE 11477]|uniref:type II toxin-antitoxin system VapC family toxin n=1 Tax=cf. Phormidesmis sp. LEGE 11477 TaxID=1828680 RepID=UPI00187EC0C5|nr:PIN domain-containing protein [cf. Phormidesmis sp. LEGE 11477]MBE9064556.1 PIN domain-containing protein [cf. Phormidesmis sp. LEGE 11477]
MNYIIDTHVLIWFLEGSAQLSDTAKAALMNPRSKLILPAIVLAEAAWIVRKAKTNIPSVTSLLSSVKRDHRMQVFPLDQTVVEKTIDLNAIAEMHDRQIVATALVIQSQGEEVALLTCDRNITDSNLVSIIW